MLSLVGARRCARCGAYDARLARASVRDPYAPLCGECLARLIRELDASRRRFAFLVRNGMTPERAQEILRRRAP